MDYLYVQMFTHQATVYIEELDDGFRQFELALVRALAHDAHALERASESGAARAAARNALAAGRLMPRYRLTLEYDGGPFSGWQRQDNGPSVQASLEDAIFALASERVTVTGAGRTDAGVHAQRPGGPFRSREGFSRPTRFATRSITICARSP